MGVSGFAYKNSQNRRITMTNHINKGQANPAPTYGRGWLTLFTAILVLAIAFTFNACGDVGEEDPSGGGSSSSGDFSSSGTSSSSGGGSSSSAGADGSSSSVEVHVHHWGIWVETTAPTCVTEGVKMRTCALDASHTETSEIAIDQDAHDWEQLSGTPATCTTEGSGTRKCNLCDKEETSGILSIDPHAHDWGNWATKTPAMCVEREVEERICNHNSFHKEDREVGEPLGHDWEWVVTTAATPTSVGLETQTCKHDPSHTNGTRPLYPKCNGQDYTPANQRCENNVVETKCGTDWYNSLTQFCNGNGVYGKCGGNDYDPSTHYCKNGTTPTQYSGSVTYSGQTYKTIEIGTQTWMAENLNYNANGSKCYGNESANCEKYGRLYDWATAMNLSQYCNSQLVTNCGGQVNAKHQGICPSDWHIPSNAEWTTLINYVESGCSGCAGTHLKAASGWSSYTGVPAGKDTYGFSALPGGCGYSGGDFNYVGRLGFWWSSSESNSSLAYTRLMSYSYGDVPSDRSGKSGLSSVRCVKD
jgi:uncharacterized protein (TIGR02145 family)